MRYDAYETIIEKVTIFACHDPSDIQSVNKEIEAEWISRGGHHVCNPPRINGIGYIIIRGQGQTISFTEKLFGEDAFIASWETYGNKPRISLSDSINIATTKISGVEDFIRETGRYPYLKNDAVIMKT